MNSIQFIGALETGLIYSFVALGVYLSFRVLQFPDMTVDGSFPLGAAVCAILMIQDYNPFFATAMAFVAGCLAGLVTSLLAIRLKILNLLSGIITMAALYSINLRVMGRPNIALIGQESAISKLQDQLVIFEFIPGDLRLVIALALILLVICVLLYKLLSSHLGLALRATGSNATMARAQGISDDKMIYLALALANGLVALGGALFAQVNGFADVSLGVGTIIIGLAAVIIGETFIPSRQIVYAILGVILGTILYRLIIAFALNGSYLGLKATDLNLVTAFLVALAMSLPQIRKFGAIKLGAIRSLKND